MQDRRLNLIFRGVKETEGDDDTRKVLSIVETAGVAIEKFRESLVAMRRLGKKEEGKLYRPILVRLTSQELREQLLRKNRLLREENERREEGTRHRIDPDLTRDQMAKLDKLFSRHFLLPFLRRRTYAFKAYA